MLYNLGVNMLEIHSKGAFQRAIQRLDREFHLVLILEEYDESLLLLRQMLQQINIHLAPH